jgi:predicted neutral ceramidase superfamily lipid hydrolase
MNKNQEQPFLFTALIGLNIISVTQLLDVTPIDIPLKISLYSFSISTPLLAFFVISYLLKMAYRPSSKFPWYIPFSSFFGSLFSLVGLTSIFCHFSWIMAVIFAFTGVLCFCSIFFQIYRFKKTAPKIGD